MKENIKVERDAFLRSHQADGPTGSFLDGNTGFDSTFPPFKQGTLPTS